MTASRGIILALLVFAAGIYVYRDSVVARFREPAAMPAATVATDTPPPAPSPAPVVAAAPEPAQAPVAAIPPREDSPSPADEVNDHPQAITLWIDENVVRELEDNRDRLRDVIYTDSTNAGWRLHVLREDNLISRAGLHDGDFVSYEGLDSQFGKSGRAELADRVAALLDSVRR